MKNQKLVNLRTQQPTVTKQQKAKQQKQTIATQIAKKLQQMKQQNQLKIQNQLKKLNQTKQLKQMKQQLQMKLKKLQQTMKH
ncbi:hypothetical protein [Staphylococcus auricularis]|uniref:hypothetical protein n=1 Tax=Staphylococcus auricularis TaxID=29379 RepID=UPI001BCC5BB1|nr:hypothetical protein [Staphylococcus auricularis]MBM0868391.1 hypothetical protein [Staphylococcus auricularis]MCG7342250.1 hypothetical protein [Staphylococcus auricularis]